jgi:hypothetical protein
MTKKISLTNKGIISINELSNQKGMTLLTVLIFVMVLVSFGVALLAMTSNDTKLSTLHRESNKAFYIAESGIEKVFYNLNVAKGVDWRPDNDKLREPEGIVDEYYEVTIENIGDVSADPPEDPSDKIKITSKGVVSKGEYSSGTREIEVIAVIDYEQDVKYKYAILSDRVIILQGSPGPTIEGDIHSNDDIEVTGKFAENYEGVATSSGDTNQAYSDDEVVEGIHVNAEVKPVPTVNYDGTGEGYTYEDSLLNEATLNGTVHDGDVDLDNSDVREWTGVHYIKGNLTAKNSAGIKMENGVIVVEGDVDIRNSGIFEHTRTDDYVSPFSEYALVATGNILLHAKSSVLNGVVQSIEKDGTSTGVIDFRNGSTIIGSVIAQTVHMHNKTDIIYDKDALEKIVTIGDGFYKKVSWQEI